MKLLLISSEFPPGPGGIGHHAYSLCKAMRNLGHEVTVLTVTDFTTEEDVRRFDQEHDFRIIRFPRIGWRTYLNRISITDSHVRKNKYDAVLLTGKFSLWIGAYLKMRFPLLKTVAILHGSEVNPSRMLLRKLTHHAIASADEIVSVSRFTASLLPQRIRDTRNIHIIPNGIDIVQLSSYNSGSVLRLEGNPKLLTVGHVSPRKGQHRVIRALPLLRKKFPTLHYHIVGRPITKDKLVALTKELGVADMVTFHGAAATHEELTGYYHHTDVFMLLSENQPDGDVEGFGIVALEANFFGLPVVGAKYCGVEDAVDDRKSGILVDGNEAVEIADAVTRCLADKQRMADASRAWAQRHDWDFIVHRFMKVIQ